MGKAKKILKDILKNGDVYIYAEDNEVTGIGLDYSWINFTQEEAQYMKELLNGE